MSSAESSGINTPEAVVNADEGRAFSDLFRRGSGANDRKTVTFGDASAVRSRPLWSLFSLIGIFVFWWASTKPWGLPTEVAGDPDLTDLLSDPELSDKLRIGACNARETCKGSFSQLVSPLQFPSVHDTWNAFRTLVDEGFQNITLWQHTKASLWRVTRGMFWGSVIGIPVGFSMGLSSRARGFFDSIVELFRPIPPLALLGLFILTFGIGDGTAVNLLIFASVWIMIISARSGVRTVKLSKVRAAYSLGASKWQVLTRVILPNSLPELFTGFRVALGVCWGTLVAAELVGTQDGLGAMIFAARPFFRLDIAVVGIIIIALLGVLMDMILRFLESVLIPWRGKG